MTAQRLYQIVSGQANANGAISFTFPPVPQGSVWTGAITIYAAHHLVGPSGGDTGGQLYGAEWSLTRNGSPLLSYTGEAIIYDVQAVGQEVVALSAVGVQPLAQLTAVWTGYSMEAASAPYLSPRLYGGQNAYTQVYTSGPGAPLDVAPTPAPAGVQVASAALGTSSSAQSVPLLAATGVIYRLWNITVSASAANSSATSTTGIILAAFVATTAGTPMTILETEPIVLANDSNTASNTIDMRGFTLPSGQGLTLNVSAFGGSAARVNATVVYDILQP